MGWIADPNHGVSERRLKCPIPARLSSSRFLLGIVPLLVELRHALMGSGRCGSEVPWG
jgi:hypothetical protein